MAHFEIDFHDKNSERYMISGRINQLLKDMYSKFVIIDSVDTGDFFLFHRNPLSCIRYKTISIYFHIDYSTGDFHFQEIIMRRMSV